MAKITPHLDSRELDCHGDGTPYPMLWLPDRGMPLAETFEDLRHGAGDFPMSVISAFRSLEYNRRLGGAKSRPGEGWAGDTSQHVLGRAMDITHARLTAAELHEIALRLFNEGQLPHLGGLGLYVRRNFIHIDVRDRGPSNHLARWNG